jgi:hypothetical protein
MNVDLLVPGSAEYTTIPMEGKEPHPKVESEDPWDNIFRGRML